MAPDTPTDLSVLRYAAFTSDGAGGNPAGVVLDARSLSEARMQQIAADVGYSETAFLFPPAAGGSSWGIRYFSPQAEVPFCGHATIASAVALAERDGTGDLLLQTQAGKVAVTTRDGGGAILATLTSVPTTVTPIADGHLAALLAALGWSADDLDPRLPPRIANAGNDHPVLAAGTRERLASLAYQFDELADLMAERAWTTIHLVWQESPAVFHARDPFPPGGVVEDPATGAAAAAFGGYLRALGMASAGDRVVVHQGEDMGRPSRLLVDITEGPDRGIDVSGAAAPITG